MASEGFTRVHSDEAELGYGETPWISRKVKQNEAFEQQQNNVMKWDLAFTLVS